MADLEDLKEGVEKIGKTFDAFKAVNDERLDKIEKTGYTDPELEAKVDKMNSALDSLAEKNEKIEASMARAQKDALINSDVDTKGMTPEMKAYQKGYARYLRKGDIEGLAELEAKALSVGSDPDGGYTVRPEVSSEILKNITETTPMRQLARVISISSDSYEQPRRTSGAASGGWVGEVEARSETGSPTLGLLNIPAHEQYAEPHATQKLLDDSAINIEAWLAEEIAEAFRLTENTAFITGNGVAKPRGILTYAAGTGDDQIEQVVSGHATLVTADGLINLQDALKEGYQPNASWLMKRSTVSAIRKLKDATNEQYLWQPGLQAGTPDMLLGATITKGADMPTIGASALAIAYGDFRLGYKIVDRIGIRVLRDPYTSKPFIKFYSTKRTGGMVVLTEALKLQKISA